MKNIYISPYNLHQDILSSLRKDDSFFDVKIITKEDFLSQIYGRVEKKYVSKIMEKHNLTYQNTREILSYIPYVNNEDTLHLSFINKIKEDVEIKNNKYLDQFFLGSEITVIGYSKFDKELVNGLEKIGVPYKFKNEYEKRERTVTLFDNIEDEVYGVLNSIAKLIDEGKNINDIYVFTRNENHIYFLRKFSKYFGFAVNFDGNESYAELESSKIFIDLLRIGTPISEAYKIVKEKYQDDEQTSHLEKYISEELNHLNQDKLIDYLTSEFKNIKLHNAKLDNAVTVINQPILDKNAYVFMIGFNQGTIPTTYKDNSYLNDIEKLLIGLNTTIDKFLMDEDLLTQFIFSKNNIEISRCRRSKGEKYFPSYLIAKFGFKVSNYEFPETLYSSEMVEYYAGKYKDLFSFYKETSKEYFGFKTLAKVPYFSYDNQFTGAEVIKPNQDQIYAYSNVKTYNECPFKYYLNRCLKIDPFETSFALKIGNIAHHIFEEQFKDDFDFEKTWESAVNKEEFEAKEKIILINLKKQIKAASDASVLHYKKHLGSIDGTKQYKNELKLKIQIDDHTYIRGNADKVVIINDQYVFVVDYKTGSESFSPKELEYGESMQLPTYALLLANSKEYENYKLVGLYINNVIEKSFKETKEEDDLIPKHLKLKGVTLNDEKIVALLDNTIADGESSFINNISFKADKTFKAKSAVISEQEFENYRQIALEFYKNKDLEIRSNNFEIKPKVFNSNKEACKYCSYRDICYVKESQKHYMSEQAKEDVE